MRPRTCSCGSHLPPDELLDGRGIFMSFVCKRCLQEKLARFRPDIFEPYETDDAIDEEDGR